MTAPSTDEHPDGGAATLWTLVAACLCIGGTLAALSLGAVFLARARAASAADLAALAAASALGEGRDGCATAYAVAGEGGSVIVACRIETPTVLVAVSVPVAPGSLGVARGASVTAWARAGPPES